MLSAYLSCASSEHARVSIMASRLLAGSARHGVGISIPDQWWTDPSFSGRDHEHPPEERRRITRRHFAAIEDADVLWFLAPSRGHHSRMAWGELGFAQAQSRALTIVVSGELATASVCTSLSDRLFMTDDEALAYIVELARSR